MLDDIKVRDIYIPMQNYPHIPDTATICDAIKLMHSSQTEAHKYRTILVHDKDERLVGHLSLRDLLRAIGPSYLKKEAPSFKGNQPFKMVPQDFAALSLIWQEGFTSKIQEEAQNPVTKYLTLFEHTVKLDDPFAKCAYLLLLEDLNVIPVVEEGKVVGVVRLVDIFENIAEHICKTMPH